MSQLDELQSTPEAQELDESTPSGAGQRAERSKPTETTVWSIQRPWSGMTSLPELLIQVHVSQDIPIRKTEDYETAREWLRPKGISVPHKNDGPNSLLRVDPGALIDPEVVWSLVAIPRAWGYEYDVRGARPGFPREYQTIARFRAQRRAWELMSHFVGHDHMPPTYERTELLRAAGVCGRPAGREPKGVFCRHCGGRL